MGGKMDKGLKKGLGSKRYVQKAEVWWGYRGRGLAFNIRQGRKRSVFPGRAGGNQSCKAAM